MREDDENDLEAAIVYYINSMDCIVEEVLIPVEEIAEVFNNSRSRFSLVECDEFGEDYLSADFKGSRKLKHGFSWQGERFCGDGIIIGLIEDRLGFPIPLPHPIESFGEVERKITFWN